MDKVDIREADGFETQDQIPFCDPQSAKSSAASTSTQEAAPELVPFHDDQEMMDVEENQVFYDVEFPAPVEDPNSYGPGGYHPIQIGDTLGSSGRFRVVHKLGDGGFSTVWLCRDTLGDTWRAVKVNYANDSSASCPDLTIMDRFSGFTAEELARKHICLPTDYFWLDGPNGRHFCTAMPLLGPRLADIYPWYATCPSLLKHICFQAAQGLSFMHENGYCHGDFRPENILFQLSDGIDQLPEDELLRLLGEPQKVKVVPFFSDQLGPGVPEYLIAKTAITFASGLCSTKIAITDMGLSYPIGGPANVGIPLSWAAPEDVFACGDLGPAADIWALGCTMMEIVTGGLPFHHDGGDVGEVIRLMEEAMGPMPQPFRDAWGDVFQYPYVNDKTDMSQHVSMSPKHYQIRRQDRFDSCGEASHLRAELVKSCLRLFLTQDQAAQIAVHDFARTGMLPGFTPLDEPADWEDRIDYQRDEEDMDLLHDLLSGIFKWRPEERMSLDQILDHPWLEVWFNCTSRETSREPEMPQANPSSTDAPLVDSLTDALAKESDPAVDTGSPSEEGFIKRIMTSLAAKFWFRTSKKSAIKERTE